MGRYSTGALTTEEVMRIELSYLLNQGIIKKGMKALGTLSWSNGSKISFTSLFTDEDKYLRLAYLTENCETGETITKDYNIQLITRPSNLGKGEIIYFVCPVSGRLARVLYKCYGSLIWKSRDAYRSRIYYSSQVCSKLSYHNTRYWAIEKQLEQITERRIKSTYKGKETRIFRKVQALREKSEYHDFLRWTILPKALLKDANLPIIRGF